MGDCRIGATGVPARFLAGRGQPSLRRVVRSPERWDRIEKIAEDLGERLPPDPDARALEEFLVLWGPENPTLLMVRAVADG